MLGRLVEVQDLKGANGSDTFGERFPELIDKLVRSSIEDDPDAEIRFVFGDTGKVSGRDGHTNTTGGENVPSGIAIWELKTSTGVRRDADADYKKRKEEYENSPEKAKKITFIYVTSRVWGAHKSKPKDMEAWCESKRAESFFRDVRAYDAQILVDWIAKKPAVARWARTNLLRLGRHNTGYESLQEALEVYQNRFGFSLSRALLLVGREGNAEQLRNRLIEGEDLIKFGAETEAEAVAFVASVIAEIPDLDLRERLLSTGLYVRNPDALEELGSIQGQVIIVGQNCAEEAHRLSRRNTIIVVSGFGSGDEGFTLSVRDQNRFADGLVECGFDRNETYDLAGKCGRSMSVLCRLQPNIKAPRPKWSETNEAQKPFPRAISLLGAFDGNFEKDIEILDLVFDGELPSWRREIRLT